jgi:molecular chaperone GrpE
MALRTSLQLVRCAPAYLLRSRISPVPRTFSAAFHVSLNSWQQQADPLSTEPLPEADKAKSGEAAGEPKDTVDPLKVAQDEVQKLRAQLAESHNGRLRLMAEMENVRTIARRDVETGKVYALQGFSKRLLDVVDNLQRAVESVPQDLRQKGAQKGAADPVKVEAVLTNLVVGVDATHRDFIKLLGQQGIESFGAVGEKFDANKHEALLEVPASPASPAGSVATVLKTGWVLKDRVLRAAQVAVAVKQD